MTPSRIAAPKAEGGEGNRFDRMEWAGAWYRTPFPAQPMKAIGAGMALFHAIKRNWVRI